MASNTTSGADGECRTLSVRPIETVPPGVPVCHYDELPESAQRLLAECGRRASVVVPPSVAAAFANEPVVVFSEYLRVELA
ncbi:MULTISPECIES: hypothetical protein [Halorussus]|uniref:hypothetical protein n=1 Tax=Halorussus TaxID=1070314 RepID=UPI00209D9861|nr:hypothetical protein [Halorussus vallis]USZ77130.1 hypothetical protein NGM07_07330 [Halorussus vallis]